MQHAPRLLALASLLFLSLLPAASRATTYVMVEDRDLADQSPLIAEAHITARNETAGTARPVTDYLAELTQVLKGSPPGSTVVVRVPGGVLPDGTRLHLHGAPHFQVGERVLLFLKPHADGTFRIAHFLLGAFHVLEEGGRELALRPLGEATEVHLKATPDPMAHAPRDLAAFATWLIDRARGLETPADYYVTTLPDTTVSGIFDKFTLFENNGLNFRWSAFDNGGVATFRAQAGGQPGLAGGGFAEFQAALAAWTNDPATPVRLNYGGTTNALGGLENFDGVNAILFNDPNDEVDESFSCSSGGVIAVGGPWSNGSTHFFRDRSWNTIVGGDIVTNRGLECWIPFNRRAEEVFAHEIGHTLGFGHSCGDGESGPCNTAAKNEAVMRANIHGDGRGASFSSDDRAGLCFLYGSSCAGEPEAPSNLSAAAESTDRIRIFWNDNASDETQFEVERRIGNGSFALIASPGANVESFLDSGLAPGATHMYRVRARNGAGPSAYSNIASATTLDIPPPIPDPPSNLAGTALSETEIRLSWQDNSDNETRFEVEGRRGSNPFTLFRTLTTNVRSVVLDGLVPGAMYVFRVRAVGVSGPSAYSTQVTVSTLQPDLSPCSADATTLCLNGGRFEVEIDWRKTTGETGVGQRVAAATSIDSSLFWFFSANNWEILVKVLDGCTINNRFWVFAAATTNVEYNLKVRDTATGLRRSYFNPQGTTAPAVTDTEAFATCDAPFAAPLATPPAVPVEAAADKGGGCLETSTAHCLNGDRFRVEVVWRDFQNRTDSGRRVPFSSNDSGLFWFFSANNWEILVKVLDGCAINNRVWVFAAATTSVEYTLRVTDTMTGAVREYVNPLGTPAQTVTDTGAFMSCN